MIALSVNIRFRNRYVRLAVFVYYTLLICLRWQVGIDFQTYVEWIEWYGYLDFSLFNEPLSIGLIKLSGVTGFPRLFFIVGGLSFMGAVFFLVRGTEDRYKDLTFLVLMAASLFPVFIVVRQYLAACCSVFALHFLLKRKYLLFVALSLIAFLFHLSSLVLLTMPLLLILLKRSHRLLFLLIPPILSIALPLSLPLLERMLIRIPFLGTYSYLLSEPQNAAMITLNPITVGLTIAVSLGVYFSINTIRNDLTEYELNSWLIGVMGIIMLVITSNIHAGRIAILFITFGIPVFVKSLYRKNVLAILVLCSACVFGTLLTYPWSCVPYNTRTDVPWNSHFALRHKLDHL
jgi:hypothetical protein